MKAIHSFWFYPFIADPTRFRDLGGFVYERYFWYCWVISFFCLRKHFAEIELITDNFGFERLIKLLKLPYTSVSLEFEALPSLSKHFWAYGKLQVYSRQTAPFIHVDADAFIWKCPPQSLLTSPVFGQSRETDPIQIEFYRPLLSSMQRHLAWLPEHYRTLDLKSPKWTPLNCGIFGGQDLTLIRECSEESKRLISCQENQSGWDKIFADKSLHPNWFNCAIEQVNIVLHCNKRGITPGTLFEQTTDGSDPADKVGYTHLVGGIKNNPDYMAIVQKKVADNFPKLKEIIDTEIVVPKT